MVMDFFAGLSSGSTDAAYSYLTSQSVLASLISGGIAEGLSGRAMLSGLRSAGLHIGNTRYWRLVGQIRRTGQGLLNVVGSLSGGTVPPGTVRLLSGGRAGQYQVNVRSFYQYEDENGDFIEEFRTTSILQRELTVAQALRDATSLIAQNTGTTESLAGTVTGLGISGVYQYTGAT